MFDFLKKKVTTFEVAGFIVGELFRSEYPDIAKDIVTKHEKYFWAEDELATEIHNLILYSGILSIHLQYGLDIAKEVLNKICGIFKTIDNDNGGTTHFTDKFIEDLHSRLDSYLVRFNRRMKLAPTGSWMNEGVSDVINEALEYILCDIRFTEMTPHNFMTLQERIGDPEELDGVLQVMFVNVFFKSFHDKFVKIRVVSG